MDARSWTSLSVREEFVCFKARRPFCYGITNYIAATLSANLLLAVGTGAPAHDQVVWDLLTFRPTAIRDNASELIALADGTGSGRGIGTTLTSDQAQPFLQNLAARTSTIAAVSGPVDYITDGVTTLTLSGGDARLTLMSPGRGALGAYSGVIANEGSKPEAVAAAHALYAEAAHRVSAARETVSFAIAFIDHLSVIEVYLPQDP